MYRHLGKRLLDLLVVIPTLLLAAPVLAVVWIWVRLDSRGPAMFVQPRLGRGGRIFQAYKFRTMTNKQRVANREILAGDEEVTRAGVWLRRFKLDELPQLWNIVTGDMSLIGPRPALPQQLPEYTELARRRLEVRPGLTGLAQVNGNIHLTWPERWQWDAMYVDRLSLWLDLWIIGRTVGVILLGEKRFLRQAPANRPASDLANASASRREAGVGS